jgi:hypothetical protein
MFNASAPRTFALVTSFVVAACAAEDAASPDPTSDPSTGKADAPAAAVSVAARSDYSVLDDCAGPCSFDYYFWVDLSVRNDAFHKQVGILWTADNWKTVHRADAHYDHPLDRGHERWSIDVHGGSFYDASDLVPNSPPHIDFAAFATMNGQTHWDPGNDYDVPRSPFHP